MRKSCSFIRATFLTRRCMRIDQALGRAVISYSYAGCEANQSASVFAGLEPLAQQANAEGITWLASSGDLGAAACDVRHTVSRWNRGDGSG